MKTIEHEYYKAYKKYYFNWLMDKEAEKIYFMGMADGLRELFEHEDGRDGELEEIREKAKADAKKDFDYYKY